MVIFHIDLDAFFASIEQKDHPEYEGKPVIVGALPGNRGVVSACSYEARKFGVHSGQPISQAFRLCPRGIFLPVRMERYAQISAQIMEIFSSFTPVVHPVSIDEAFLDMTGTQGLFGLPISAGAAVKEKVKIETRLTATIGIAPNYYIAKLASKKAKPDGLIEIHEHQIEAFLDSLQLKDLWGLGEKTQKRLEEIGIVSIPQLRSIPLASLSGMLGKGLGQFLYNACRGIESDFFRFEPKSRSISTEHTFAKDTADRQNIETCLLQLSHELVFRLLDEQLQGKTPFLKLRTYDFATTTAQKTLKHSVMSAQELYEILLELLKKRWDGHTPIRLIGAGIADIQKTGNGEQMELFEDPREKNIKVEKAVLAIRTKYDAKTITKASLIQPKAQKTSKTG